MHVLPMLGVQISPLTRSVNTGRGANLPYNVLLSPVNPQEKLLLFFNAFEISLLV